MRCISCDRGLNDFEATRRVVSTGDFLDLCNKCYKDIQQEVPTIARGDLNKEELTEDAFDYETWVEDGGEE